MRLLEKTDLTVVFKDKALQQWLELLLDDILVQLPMLHVASGCVGSSLLCSLQHSLKGERQGLSQAANANQAC